MTTAEARELWVKALRSGKYIQGEGRLRDVNFRGEAVFCCLGVACDLYAKHTGNGYWDDDGIDGSFSFVTDIDHSDIALPREVANWLGLDTVTGEFRHPTDTYYQDEYGAEHLFHAAGEPCDLTCMNDNHGATFEEIADLIESNPDNLILIDVN